MHRVLHVQVRLAEYAPLGIPHHITVFLLVLWLAVACERPLLASEYQEFPGASTGASPATELKESRKRLVAASELAALVRKGSRLHVDHAIIRGKLDLSYTVIQEEIFLTGCEFEDEPDFSYSTFKRHLILDGSTFEKGVRFDSTITDLNARLNDTHFLSGEALFRDMQVHGRLSMQNSRFAEGARVTFARAHFDKGATFANSVFADVANFSDVETHSDLMFQRAQFRKQFVITTAKIAGSLFMTDAEFDGPAQFPGMEVVGNVKIEGAIFRERANFGESQINSFLDLSGTKFEFRDRPANFTRAAIAAGGFFDRVYFAGGAKFEGTHFNADASFDGAFFDGSVSFDRARFEQTGHFEHCIFRKDVSFDEASFGKLELSSDGRVSREDQFQGHVGLQGCTYGRIQAHWQSLLVAPDGQSRLRGVDKQPYLQLQKFYEGSGNDTAANEVSLEWHRVRRQELFRSSKFRWLIDCVPWITTNYGVAAGRLLEISITILFLGMLVFSRPGAVLSGVPNGQAALGQHQEGSRLNHWEALAVSFHQFLPLEVPVGSGWTPAKDPVIFQVRRRHVSVRLLRIRPTTCATVLKVSGYILVPLQILVLNGLLRSGVVTLPWQ